MLPIKILKEKLNLINNKNFVFHSDLTILGRELPSLKGQLIKYISQELNANNLAIPAFNLKTNNNTDFIKIKTNIIINYLDRLIDKINQIINVPINIYN